MRVTVKFVIVGGGGGVGELHRRANAADRKRILRNVIEKTKNTSVF